MAATEEQSSPRRSPCDSIPQLTTLHSTLFSPDKRFKVTQVPKTPETTLEGFRLQFSSWAKFFDNKAVHALFGTFDGLSLEQSVLRYVFDAICYEVPDIDGKVSRDATLEAKAWGHTTEGKLIELLSSLLIVGWSVAGNLDTKKKSGSKSKSKSKDKKSDYPDLTIKSSWEYVRLGIKAMKNAQKGLRSLFTLIHYLDIADIRHLLIPSSLVLGSLSVLNRWWARREIDRRKVAMTTNIKALESILHSRSKFQHNEQGQWEFVVESTMLADYKRDDYESQPGTQLILSQVYAGLIDSFYLYLGVFSLTTSAYTPLMYYSLCVSALIFVVSCVAQRMYEEYENQNKLEIIKCKIDAAIASHEYEEAILRGMDLLLKKGPLTEAEQQDLTSAHEKLVISYQKLESHYQKLANLTHQSRWLLMLAGIRDALSVYSAILSILFSTSAVLTLLSVAIPSMLVMSAVSLGLASVIGFAAYYVSGYEPLNINDTPISFYKELKNDFETKNLSKIDDHRIQDMFCIKFDGLEHHKLNENDTVKDGFEVLRALSSGVSKGQKTADFIFTSLSLDGDQEYYKDIFNIIAAVGYMGVLASKAYAKGFTKDEPKMMREKEVLEIPKRFENEHEIQTDDEQDEKDDLDLNLIETEEENAQKKTKLFVINEEEAIRPATPSIPANPELTVSSLHAFGMMSSHPRINHERRSQSLPNLPSQECLVNL